MGFVGFEEFDHQRILMIFSFLFRSRGYSRIFMKVRGFGLGRSVAVRRGEVMLRRARLSFSNPNHSPRKQLKTGMNAMRYCEYIYCIFWLRVVSENCFSDRILGCFSIGCFCVRDCLFIYYFR